MSFRGGPQTLEEKINWIAEQLRSAQRGVVSIPPSIGQVNEATHKGDLQVGTDAGIFDLLSAGPDGEVLTSDSLAPDGVAWKPRTSMTGWPWTGVGI